MNVSVELIRVLGDMLSKLGIHIKYELSGDPNSDIGRKEFEALQHKIQLLYQRKEYGSLSPIDLDDLEVDLYSRGIEVLSREPIQ